MSENDPLDIVWGVDAIGKLIGRNFTQTYHLIKSDQLPMVKRVGKRYYASRAKLAAFFTEDAHDHRVALRLVRSAVQ